MISSAVRQENILHLQLGDFFPVGFHTGFFQDRLTRGSFLGPAIHTTHFIKGKASDLRGVGSTPRIDSTPPFPNLPIDQLHKNREAHREVDVTLFDVEVNAFSRQHDPNQEQEGQRKGLHSGILGHKR